MSKPFVPCDDVCGDCSWLSEENCEVCPMRKWNDAQKMLRNVRDCLDYLRNGGIPKEYAIQIAICEDILNSLIGK